MTIIVDDMAFDDELSTPRGHENLWSAVLLNAIEEAVHGISRSFAGNEHKRIRANIEAREYITVPNRGFNEVCHLAGVDPEAVRERVMKRLADAPTPEELALTKRREVKTVNTHAPCKPNPNTKRYSHNGREMTLAELSALSGVSPATIRHRLLCGWPVSRAIEKKDQRTRPNTPAKPDKPANTIKLYTHDGKTLTISQWAEVTGLPHRTIRSRLSLGWSLEDTLTKSRKHSNRTPGVVSNCPKEKGTGAGSTAQETPNISFSGNQNVSN